MAEPVIRVQEPTAVTSVRARSFSDLQTVSQAKQELETRLLAIHEDLQLTQNIGLLFVKRQEDLRTCFEQLQQLEQLEQQQRQQQHNGDDNHDLDSSSLNGSELPSTFKDQLAQLDKEFQEGQNGLLGLKGLIDAQLPSTSSNDATQASSVLGPSALPSSALPVQNITKPRRHKVAMPSGPSINDPAFPVQIQDELLNQVRYWTSQAEMKEKLNQEYDTKIQEMERIIDALNKQRRMREESEERQKEDQWNLELLNQELRSQNNDLQSQLSKALHENQKLQKSFAAATEQLEQIKDKEEKTAGQLELTKTRHEQDMQTMRKHTAGLQREKSDLLKKIEELNNLVSVQEKKLKTKASQETMLTLSEPTEQAQEEAPVQPAVVVEEPAPVEIQSIEPPASLDSPEPKQTSLARETSFAHQQSIISELQTKLSQSMSERDELKKLLADREETIEQLRLEGPEPSFGPMSHSSPSASEGDHFGGHGDENGGHDAMEYERMDSLASQLEGSRAATPMRGLFDELAQASASTTSTSAPPPEVKDEEVMTDPIDHWVLAFPLVAEKLAALEATKEALTKEAAEATKALQAAQIAHASHATESASSSEALKAAQAAQEEYAARVQEATAALEAARAESVEAIRVAKEAQAAQEAHANELAKAKAAYEAQSKQLAETKAEQEAQANELAKVKAEHEMQASELAKTKAEHELQAKELAKTKAAQEAQITELAQAKAIQDARAKELEEAKAAHEAYIKELAETKAARDAHVQELAQAKAAREMHTKELEQAKAVQEAHAKELADAKTAQEAYANELAEAKAAQEAYANELAEAKAAATAAAAALAAATAATTVAAASAAVKSSNQDSESLTKEANGQPIQLSKSTQVAATETTSNATQTAPVERSNASTSPRASIDVSVSTKKGDLADIITGKPGTHTTAITPVDSALATPIIASLEIGEAQLQELQAPGKDIKVTDESQEPVRRKVHADAYLNEPRRHTCDMSQGYTMSDDEVPPVPDVPLHHRDSIASAATGSTAPRDSQSERDYRVSIGSAFGGKPEQGTMSTGRIRSVYHNKEDADGQQHHQEPLDEETGTELDPVSPGRPASDPPSSLLAKARTLANESTLAHNDVLPAKEALSNVDARQPSSSEQQQDGRAPSIRSLQPYQQQQQQQQQQPPQSQRSITQALSPPRSMGAGAAIISGPTRTAYTFHNNSSQVHAPGLSTSSSSHHNHHHVITDSSGASIRRHYRPSPNGSISSMSTDYGHDRRLSVSSQYDPNNATPTDPTMIQIITQTMIGDYLWKYTRRPMASVMSDKRHRRYFWVHPYSRTINWSLNNPAAEGSREQRSKSALIIAVYQVTDENPVNPSDLPNISLVVQTSSRNLKLTAPSREKHDLWYQSLSYLLSRPTTPGADVTTDHQTWSEVQASRGVTSDTLLTIRSPDRQVRKKGSMNRLQNMFGRSKDNSPASSPRGLVSASSHSIGGTGGGAPQGGGGSVIGYPSHMANTAPGAVGGHGTINGGPIMSQASSDLGTASSPRSRMNEVFNARSGQDNIDDDDLLEDDDDDLEDGVLPEHVRQCCDGRHDIGSLHHSH